MPQGLAVSDVVSVGVILSPTAAVGRDFGTLLIIGSSPVIDVRERIREYATLTQVAADFGTSAPEYLAATAYFSQSPMPFRLKIGRWAQAASSALLRGATFTATQQIALMSALNQVTSGSLTVTIDGSAVPLTGLNFSAAANLNAVAAVINTALGSAGGCTWNGSQFVLTSATAGTTSTITYPSSPSGTNIALTMGLTSAGGASAPIAGINAETAVAGVQVLASATADWYAATFAPLTPLSNSNALLVAATIEGMSPSRVVGFTTQEAGAIDQTSVNDLAYLLHASNYSRAFVQYSSTHAYAVCSFFGRALTVNFNGSRTTITMKFKQEPGIIAETLSETQATALNTKCANVFVNYMNNTAIVQQGTVASGRFFDEVHGLDWLANAVQADLFNVLYQSLSKVPQTDEGVHTLVTQFEATLSRSVENGLVAPGIWNAEGFGMLKRGDALTKGFYVYAPLVASQSQADREARKAPLLQAAIKMAGAVHFVDAQISVNR
jgi:hypothetical protein